MHFNVLGSPLACFPSLSLFLFLNYIYVFCVDGVVNIFYGVYRVFSGESNRGLQA